MMIRRLGSDYGGWWIPEWVLTEQNLNILSAGAGEDLTFEVELMEYTTHNILIVDPTPRAINHYNSLIQYTRQGRKFPINNNENYLYKEISLDKLKYLDYMPKGIWNKRTKAFFSSPKNEKSVSHSLLNIQQTKDGFEAECVTITDLLQHQNIKNFDLIKLDIEGAEYQVLESIISNNQLPRVLCCEFHENDVTVRENMSKEQTIKMMLLAGYVIIKKEDHNYTFERNYE